MVWIKFIICAGVILLSGSRLTHYADAIAERTGLGKAWIGLVLLATITSLPELANGLSAVSFVAVPDLAAGDILGACMMNMFTLSILDLDRRLSGRRSIFINSDGRNITAALFGIGMLVFTALSIFLSRLGIDLNILGASVFTAIIAVIYVISQKAMFGRENVEETVESKGGIYRLATAHVYFRFAGLGLLVIAAGSWLPSIGNEMIELMGWGKTFVGVLFLGFATTLPEMAVSFSALRIGQTAMSKGNLLGSNLFNLGLLFIFDIAYRRSSLLADISPNFIYAALFGAVLTGIAFLAMKSHGKIKGASFAMVIIYLLSLYVLFRLGVS